jgi:hypothetical protein
MKTYFVQAASGPIKIGKSKDLRLRLMGLCWHEPIRLLGFLEGDHERPVHDRFASLRIRGEWFRPDKKLLAFISGATRPAADLDSANQEELGSRLIKTILPVPRAVYDRLKEQAEAETLSGAWGRVVGIGPLALSYVTEGLARREKNVIAGDKT